MKIKPKAAIADWHHVNAPWLLGLSIDPDEYRHRLAPARLEFHRTFSTDQYVRIDVVDFDYSLETQTCHVSSLKQTLEELARCLSLRPIQSQRGVDHRIEEQYRHWCQGVQSVSLLPLAIHVMQKFERRQPML